MEILRVASVSIAVSVIRRRRHGLKPIVIKKSLPLVGSPASRKVLFHISVVPFLVPLISWCKWPPSNVLSGMPFA